MSAVWKISTAAFCRCLIAVFLGLAMSIAAASAGERIERFASDATINPDGSLTVRETILWSFENLGPKRGLLRDFPTRYKDRKGLAVSAGFDVLSVKRDGQGEPFAVENIANGKRIRIGDKDVFLDEGGHRYEIIYKTTRQLGFFDGFDELYWNVTGNAWTMPIDKAEAVVRLPPGARIIQSAGYTGPDGAAGQDFRVVAGEGAVFRAETTRPLSESEGFTIAVGFTKGVVPPPSDADIARQYMADNAGLAALLAGVIGILGYYLWGWSRVGRDPPKGVIIPLFAPPPALGPAGARYIWRQTFDDKTFAAAMVGLAVKGRARIFDDGGDHAVEKLADSGPPLTHAEAMLYGAMPGSKTGLVQANHARVGAMRNALGAALDKEFDGVAFLRNISWSVWGIILSVVALVAAALLAPGGEGILGLFAAVWTAGWWAGILFMLWKVAQGLRSPGVASKLGSVATGLFAIPFIGAGTAAPILIMSASPSLQVIAIFAGGVVFALINAVFFKLMKAPTISGRKLLDQIEGFRMYLATAEEDRLNSLTPPEKTPELFEKFLPYALALDCENEWAGKFTSVLAAAGLAAPAWYVGSHWGRGGMGGFTNSIGSSLAAATASSHSPPGSSSGSGGGGSSGGGGGGGGGSSW